MYKYDYVSLHCSLLVIYFCEHNKLSLYSNIFCHHQSKILLNLFEIANVYYHTLIIVSTKITNNPIKNNNKKYKLFNFNLKFLSIKICTFRRNFQIQIIVERLA